MAKISTECGVLQLNGTRTRPKGLVLTHISLQNEKCHLLIEHETQKLKELDEEHSQEIKDWREKLRPRKKVPLMFHNMHHWCRLVSNKPRKHDSPRWFKLFLVSAAPCRP